MEIWQSVMKYIEDKYMELIESGAAPQEARSILPNSLKTEIVVTMNLRDYCTMCKYGGWLVISKTVQKWITSS